MIIILIPLNYHISNTSILLAFYLFFDNKIQQKYKEINLENNSIEKHYDIDWFQIVQKKNIDSNKKESW